MRRVATSAWRTARNHAAWHFWWLPERLPRWEELPTGAQVFVACGFAGATGTTALLALLGFHGGAAASCFFLALISVVVVVRL